ncbi:uncharacterized protein LOC143901227 isoform X2 [Temnothorax americanus]
MCYMGWCGNRTSTDYRDVLPRVARPKEYTFNNTKKEERTWKKQFVILCLRPKMYICCIHRIYRRGRKWEDKEVGRGRDRGENGGKTTDGPDED